MTKKSDRISKKPAQMIPPPGREPTPEDLRSIWKTDYIPEWAVPASEDAIAEAETQLGVKIPGALKEQLAVRNGGYIFLSEETIPFEDTCPLWTNAIVDGILEVEEWESAADNNWFDDVSDVDDLDLLVIFAGHSEAQLCLDFRAGGAKKRPSVAYVDVSATPTELTTIAKTADQFVLAIIKSKQEA